MLTSSNKYGIVGLFVLFKSIRLSLWLILDKCKNLGMKLQQNKDEGKILPRIVILVGHLMGQFISWIVVLCPNLRKAIVDIIFTLFSFHM